jgi:hypothetical protein
VTKQRFGGLKHGPVDSGLRGKPIADKVIAERKPLPRKPLPAPERAKPKKMADGGVVYGSPLSTPKPGGTTHRRPKVGDRSPDTRLLHPKKRGPSSAPPKKGGSGGSTYRDYRGVDGAVDDAEKGK